jgi:hypothetical protein
VSGFSRPLPASLADALRLIAQGRLADASPDAVARLVETGYLRAKGEQRELTSAGLRRIALDK